ncbi:MAG: ferrous iron transport protein B [Clostridiales bacterium]|jgi:ferrous iron transport protein B|uniref:ferrous iron transport protein B n=1 Tax=Clostridium sp. 2218st1_F5_2218SCRN_220325 TaxID=3143056 RepID=UPI0025FC943B|nr:ferrous iron transport protein B [uncultured Intestinibacter sp.]MDU1201414.1 ferrous iron transport protein B [Clostridiales bacterium]
MSIRIALAGNPNCGKTTLFNDITGSKQHVGNWPGVTVEQKTGKYKKNKEIEIVDLPGIYSLSPYSAEEIVARDYIVDENPDVLIDIVDGTNIERNLYLTLQVLETKIPTVIALNMMDEVEASGTKIDVKKLSKILGVPVIPIVARNGKGVNELMEAAQKIASSKTQSNDLEVFSPQVNNYITEIVGLLNDNDNQNHKSSSYEMWQAIKILEEDEIVIEKLPGNKRAKITSIVEKANSDFNGDTEAEIADQRYKFISEVVNKTVSKPLKANGQRKETTSDKIDKVLTNRIIAIPAFLVIMYALFSITFGEGPLGIGVWLQTIVTDFWDGPFTETIMGAIESMGAADWATGLVGDGILAGVGGVVSFLPQILVLFLLMSFLEDSGYMARVAFVMDRLFRRFGLSGKSFIPLLMGYGCSVPAVMASRTLESEKDRRLTIMITPFMSCGAKLPIYLMFAATLFTQYNQTLIIYSIYMIGIVVAVIGALILSNTLFKGETSNFIMELPQYRIPTLRSVLIHAWEKVKGFAIKAGTIILGSTILIWFLSSFNFSGMCEMDESILASIGRGIQWIFTPLGFGEWRASVAVVTGWIAKENIVSTFGVLFGAADAVSEAAAEGTAALPGLSAVFTQAAAFSYMAFNLLCMPCFAAVGAIKKEMGSWKWTGITIAFQMITAYIVAFIVYHVCMFIF